MKVVKADFGRWGFSVEVQSSLARRGLRIEVLKREHPAILLDNKTLCPLNILGPCLPQRKEEK
jgi:hypothetical protein